MLAEMFHFHLFYARPLLVLSPTRIPYTKSLFVLEFVGHKTNEDSDQQQLAFNLYLPYMKYNSTYHPQFITATILEWKHLLEQDSPGPCWCCHQQGFHKRNHYSYSNSLVTRPTKAAINNSLHSICIFHT